jgi:hypothetical protein
MLSENGNGKSDERPAMFVWSNYWEHGRYGMFSRVADAKVHHVVQTAIGGLLEIAKDHPEVSETMVRDIICDAIERQLWAAPRA